jgi:hypothetical protein
MTDNTPPDHDRDVCPTCRVYEGLERARLVELLEDTLEALRMGETATGDDDQADAAFAARVALVDVMLAIDDAASGGVRVVPPDRLAGDPPAN